MIGLLPMAGHAKRWNGTYKELLPIGENRWLCDSVIDAMRAAGIRRFIFVTSLQKIGTHAQHFNREKYQDIEYSFVIQKGTELWSAIRTAMPHCEARSVYFGMPDTIVSPDTYRRLAAAWYANIVFGVFRTNEGYRYSVVEREPQTPFYIHTKQENRSEGWAWGAWKISPTVVQFWKERDHDGYYDHYDRALEDAARMSNPGFAEIDYYNDLENWRAYQEYIHDTHS